MPSPPPETQTQGFYDDPLVYDVLHAAGTAAEVRGMAKIAAKFGPAPRRGKPRWLEPACGSGRFLRAAHKRGIAVAGFDLSKPMIDFARKRQPQADARVADMTEFMIDRWRGRFDLAFNTINTIRHLPDDRAMLDHFAQIAQALKPGGVYVVGLSLSHYGHEGPAEDVWTASRGSLRVTQIVQYEPPSRRGRSERVHSHFVIERPRGTVHRDSSYTLRSYNLAQWSALIKRSPLRLIASIDEQSRELPAADGCYRLFVLGNA